MSLSKQRRDGTETQAGTENKTEGSDRVWRQRVKGHERPICADKQAGLRAACASMHP